MPSTFPKMSEAAVLQAYRVVLVIETTFIFIGNAFTIFVFWNQRHYLKRASSLLINLAVADFLVGARELIDTLTNYNDRMMFAQGDVPLIISAILFSSVSVFSLLVISLERAYAVIWPFRHRVARSGIYVTIILMVWFAGLCVATVNGLAVYGIVRYLTSFSFTSCALFICLSLVLATYMTIRTRLRSTPPVCAAETQNRKLVEHNIKLSKTVFIVIGLSFGLWLPAITVYTILGICHDCLTGTLHVHAVSLATVLHFANSLANPIVYSYRMPMFKAALKKLLRS